MVLPVLPSPCWCSLRAARLCVPALTFVARIPWVHAHSVHRHGLNVQEWDALRPSWHAGNPRHGSCLHVAFDPQRWPDQLTAPGLGWLWPLRRLLLWLWRRSWSLAVVVPPWVCLSWRRPPSRPSWLPRRLPLGFWSCRLPPSYLASPGCLWTAD